MENTFGINIIPDNDIQRIEALRRYQILDTPPEGAFDNVARLATQIFNVPISLISLVDAEQVYFKANIGMGKAKVTTRGVSLCSLAVLKPGVTVFENAPEEPCLLTNPNVAGSFGLKFYAGAPLTTHDGFRIGTLCVIDQQNRKFSKKEENILEGLAKIVMDEIELRLSAINESDKAHQVNEELTLLAEQLAYVNNAIPQQVWTATPDGLLDFVNDQTIQYFGKAAIELLGKSWVNVIHPDDLEATGKAWLHAITTGEPYQTEFRLLSKGNAYLWHLARATAFSENGKIVKWFGTNTNIDSHKRLEQHKSDFISIASHELKTPITSLKVSLQLLDRLKAQIADPLVVKLIEQSNRGISKVSGLVDDLLSVSRINEGQVHINKTTFYIYDLLDCCCNHVMVDGKYNVVVEGELKTEVFADEHLIEQVVVNLVNNAVKYAPDSKVIRLVIAREPAAVKISVIDGGPGISAEKIPHLFDRYYRADHSGKQYSGLGLGLFICSEIIKRHNGQIGVESELGKGSAFWFTLPLKVN